MANPQLENGYTKIANELLEALAGIRISGEARQVLDVIFRKTYGFNKKEDKISLSQFCLITKMTKPRVCQAINKLILMNIITKKGNTVANIYCICKDFSTWKALPKKENNNKALPKKEIFITKKGNPSLPKIGHTKETTTKETITKEIDRAQSAQIQRVMHIFSNINPSLNWKNLTIRKGAVSLINKFGLEETLRMAEAVISIQGRTYAPVATDPRQMWDKLAKFKIYFDKERNNKPKVGIV